MLIWSGAPNQARPGKISLNSCSTLEETYRSIRDRVGSGSRCLAADSDREAGTRVTADDLPTMLDRDCQ